MSADLAKALICASILACLASGAQPAHAATFVINNQNGANVGFNDPGAPNPAAGCNAGETIGQCRLRVFTQAAIQWGALLQSNVAITINGSMTALSCPGTTAVLGQAGPNSWHANFTNAPRPGTAYVQALANSLAGSDLSATNDMLINFNVSIDAGCLNGVSGWWYGTDPSVPPPADRTPLLPVVFHEIGHGLGFTSGYAQSGAAATSGAPGSIPVWGHFLVDAATQVVWKDMTNGQRAASAINDPNLVWGGSLTNQWAPSILGNPAALIINSPAPIAGAYDAQTAEFGASVATNPVTGDVVLVNDGVAAAGGGTINDACETPFVNAAAVVGRIALVDRGFCNFTVKVKNAELAGAIGVIVANNAAGLPPMGGADPTITIPSLGVTQALGNSIKANLGTGVNASLALDPTRLAGTTAGCVRMYGPNPYEGGSSVSHFSTAAFPNLLMEPSLNRTIFDRVDLTLPLFRDIGWQTGFQDILFVSSFDANPCTYVQP